MSVIFINPYRFGYTMTDADAAAYVARVEGASGDNQRLEDGVRRAIDDFVIGCKLDGIWNAIKASCILAGAHTLSGALQPVVGTAPTNYNFVNDDYNRKTGALGDGATKYLDSNRANDADPQNSNHNAVYISTVGAAGSAVMGSSNGESSTSSGSNALLVSGATRNRASTASASLTIAGPTFFGTNRSSSANYIRRVNSSNATTAQASQTPTGGNVWIFARNTNAPSYSDSRLSFYSIGESLDLAILDARVTTLINALAAAIP